MADAQIPADISTKLDNLLRAVERNTHEISQVKNQYSALDVAVNRIQTKVLEKLPANQFEASESNPPIHLQHTSSSFPTTTARTIR